MAMGQARAYGVSVLLFALAILQVAVGTIELLSQPELFAQPELLAEPELLSVTAMAAGKLVFGLLLLWTTQYVADLQKRGLVLAIVCLSGVVVAYAWPLMTGDRGPIPMTSVLLALVLMVYLFLHEDAFGPRTERQLSEETNTHEFIR